MRNYDRYPVIARTSYLLAPKGIRCGDDAPGVAEYPHPNHDKQVRTFVGYIEMLLPDDEAWEALFTEAERLACFRTIHGNRPGSRARKRRSEALD